MAAVALLVSLLAGIAPAHAATAPGASYFPLTPSRLLDTRTGTGAPATKLGAGASIDLTVVGAGGVPASGVAAVVLNVTATDVSGPDSFPHRLPCGQGPPAGVEPQREVRQDQRQPGEGGGADHRRQGRQGDHLQQPRLGQRGC